LVRVLLHPEKLSCGKNRVTIRMCLINRNMVAKRPQSSTRHLGFDRLCIEVVARHGNFHSCSTWLTVRGGEDAFPAWAPIFVTRACSALLAGTPQWHVYWASPFTGRCCCSGCVSDRCQTLSEAFVFPTAIVEECLNKVVHASGNFPTYSRHTVSMYIA
jgi:hypothetical protein